MMQERIPTREVFAVKDLATLALTLALLMIAVPFARALKAVDQAIARWR
jgi:hypothetical protein